MWHIKRRGEVRGLDARQGKDEKQKFIVKLLILCRSMFIISHLSRSSNNNVLSSLRYRHIKHLSSLSQPAPDDSQQQKPEMLSFHIH